MRQFKKVFIGLGIVLILALLVNFGLNLWIKHQLPQIINDENNSPHQISYKDISVSLFTQNIQISDIDIVPKNSVGKDTIKRGLYAKAERIEVVSFGLIDLLRTDKITARSLIISDPDITLYREKNKKDNQDDNGRLDKIITVSDLYINRGKVKIIESGSDREVLVANNVNFNLEGILVSDQTIKQDLPLTYRQYSLTTDSIYYRAGQYYDLKTNKISVTDRQVDISKIKLLPRYSRAGFSNVIDKEQDLFAVAADSATIRNMIWGFKDEDFFYSAQSVNFFGLDANIYRDKTLPDDPKKKKLYSEQLREIDFDLKVDTLRFQRSKLVYEEAKNEYGAGKLIFNNFNLTATSLNSGYKKTKVPNVDIKINCTFMNAAKFETEWTFNILDKSDSFNIKGRIYDLPLDNMSAFTKPYLNAKTKGVIDRVYFNFSGNDLGSKGDFAIEYDDLKVEIFRKKDRKKKNKILSAIANLFVKNDTNDEVTTAEVAVDRDQQKSFFNLLWISIADGLKKILV